MAQEEKEETLHQKRTALCTEAPSETAEEEEKAEKETCSEQFTEFLEIVANGTFLEHFGLIRQD